MCRCVCVCVQNRCTSGLISCVVEASVTPWSKDSIEIRVKRLSLSLSQTSLSTNSFAACLENGRQYCQEVKRQGWAKKPETLRCCLLFDEVPPAALWPLRRSCSPFPLPLFVSVHLPRLFLCLLIPSATPILIVFRFWECNLKQLFFYGKLGSASE